MSSKHSDNNSQNNGKKFNDIKMMFLIRFEQNGGANVQKNSNYKGEREVS